MRCPEAAPLSVVAERSRPSIRFLRPPASQSLVLAAESFVLGLGLKSGLFCCVHGFIEFLSRRYPSSCCRVEEPQVHLVSLESESQNLAEKSCAGPRDGVVAPLSQPETLKRRLQVLLERIEEEVLPNSEDVAVEIELLVQVIFPRLLRGDLDDKVRALALFPEPESPAFCV